MSKRWELHDVRSNSAGTYYTLTQRTLGTLDACVTVKQTKHDTFACLTCHSIACKHAEFVAKHLESHPVTKAAS